MAQPPGVGLGHPPTNTQRSQLAVVVTKDLDGTLSVEQTDHMVREGAAGLGAVGFAVGLFAPPLLAATAVGAAIGAMAGRTLHHRVKNKLEEQAEETIPLGGSGLILAYPRSAAQTIEPVVTRAVSKVVGEPRGTTSRPLKARSPMHSRRWLRARDDSNAAG